MFDHDDVDDLTIDGSSILEAIRDSAAPAAVAVQERTATRWAPPPVEDNAVIVTRGRSRLSGAPSAVIGVALLIGVLVVGLAVFVVRPGDAVEQPPVDTTVLAEEQN